METYLKYRILLNFNDLNNSNEVISPCIFSAIN